MQTELGKNYATMLSAHALEQVASWSETASARIRDSARLERESGSLKDARALLSDADIFRMLAIYARQIIAGQE